MQTVLSSLRWRLTAAQLGIRIDRATALREYYLSQVVNQVLPGGVLGDAGRAIRARAQAGLMVSSQAVVFERIAGQLALLAVLLAAFLATLAVPGGTTWPAMATATAWIVAAGVGLVALAGWFLARIGSPVRAVPRVARDFARAFAAPAVRWRQLSLSLGTAGCNVAAFAFCGAAVGAGLPIATALVLVPLILFAMVIPISVSGWGLREGAAAAVFPLAGATAAEGLAASVAFGLIFLAASLPGLAFVGAPPVTGAMKP